MKKLKDEVKRLREGLGLSQTELAAAAGKTPGFISQVETGHRKSLGKPETVFALCRKLGVPPDHFAGYISARSTGRAALPGYSVPLVGIVGAGPAVDDAAPAGERLVVNDLFPGDVVAYTVRGRSMEADGMLPGDYIIVRRSPDPSLGELVVVWVKSLGGTVVKRLKGRGAKRWVESGDGWRHDLSDEDRVYGAYAGVIRKGRP